jgi:hypothetical protein
MSIPTGAVVGCCSYKQVFSEGEFGWLITSSTPIKSPQTRWIFPLFQKKKKTNKIKKIKN